MTNSFPRVTVALFSLLPLVVFVSSVRGGDFMVSLDPADEPSEWRFRVTPYMWAAGISGDFAQFGLPEVAANKSFSDVLENLDIGVMAAFEGMRGRYGFLADLMHVRLSGSGVAAAGLPFPVALDVTSTSTTGMLAGQFRWLDSAGGYLDVIGGARMWALSTRIRAGSPVNQSRRDRARWVDPVVGVKGLRSINERFYLTGWIMAGGYVGNAEPFVDLMAGVGYKINDQVALIAAYRQMTVDYRDGAFVYDAVQHGFGLGLDIRF